MENKLFMLIFHSGSGGHFISQQLFRCKQNYNEFYYMSNAEYIKGQSFEVYEKFNKSLSRMNKVRETIEAIPSLPKLGDRYFYTGHLEAGQVDFAKINIKKWQNKDVWTMYGGESYGIHTIMGRVKRHLNNNQKEMFTQQEALYHADNMRLTHYQPLGNQLNWDKIFLDPDVDYITDFFHSAGCDEFEYNDYFDEYLIASLNIVLEYYPLLKQSKIIKKFPKNILERVL